MDSVQCCANVVSRQPYRSARLILLDILVPSPTPFGRFFGCCGHCLENGMMSDQCRRQLWWLLVIRNKWFDRDRLKDRSRDKSQVSFSQNRYQAFVVLTSLGATDRLIIFQQPIDRVSSTWYGWINRLYNDDQLKTTSAHCQRIPVHIKSISNVIEG